MPNETNANMQAALSRLAETPTPQADTMNATDVKKVGDKTELLTLLGSVVTGAVTELTRYVNRSAGDRVLNDNDANVRRIVIETMQATLTELKEGSTNGS